MSNPASVKYDRPGFVRAQHMAVPGKTGFEKPEHTIGDTVLEFRGNRPKTLQVGGAVVLCQPEPFGYYDHFNGHTYTGKNAQGQAEAAKLGGNKITPLYEEIP